MRSSTDADVSGEELSEVQDASAVFDADASGDGLSEVDDAPAVFKAALFRTAVIVALAHAFMLALYLGWLSPLLGSGEAAGAGQRNALDMSTVAVDQRRISEGLEQ